MLSLFTKKLAERYVCGAYRSDNIPCGVSGKIGNMSEYAAHIEKLAAAAPIVVREGELIVGSAVFKEAQAHLVPGTETSSVSHTTLDFGFALDRGISGMKKLLEEKPDTEFYRSLLRCLAAFRLWCARHGGYVPDEPPRNFSEAVQALRFWFGFCKLCGNWPGLGRLDLILGKYLENDAIPLDEAREILAHFWIRGCEWAGMEMTGGDAQSYQNVIIGGRDASGRDVTNEVSYLILDVVEELHLADFPVTVRLHPGSPERLFRRTAEVQAAGGGMVAVYNEDMVIRALTKFGIPGRHAWNFTNDGCWEMIIPGRTAFTYQPTDLLQILQRALDAAPENCGFEELCAEFERQLRLLMDEVNQSLNMFGNRIPTLMIALLCPACLESGMDYFDGGVEYPMVAIHAGGIPDVGNSLYALKRLVYERKLVDFAEMRKILLEDWRGHEELRREAASLILYGNDEDAPDLMVKRVFDTFARIVAEKPVVNGILRPAGVSTFGREIAFAPYRRATGFGKKQGEYLAGNLTPTPGTEHNGVTAIIKSYCKMDFTGTPNGCPLDLRLDAGTLAAQGGAAFIEPLLRAFLELGGLYMQIDVVDRRILLDAQKRPELHSGLTVRISGWSTRFVSLSREWQDMIINRTEQNR